MSIFTSDQASGPSVLLLDIGVQSEPLPEMAAIMGVAAAIAGSDEATPA